MDCNPHLIHLFVIVMMTLSVLAADTLAFLRTLQSGTETLTVLLFALGLLARAFPHRDKGGNVLEEPGVAVVGDLLRLVDLVLVLGLVSATYTDTVFIASSPSGETLAIQF